MEILNERYIKLEKAGEGGFGTIYKCQDKESNQTVAIKKLLKSQFNDYDDDEYDKYATNEINNLSLHRDFKKFLLTVKIFWMSI